MVIVGGKNADWSTDGLTWHRGASTMELPLDGGVYSPNHQTWLVGSLVLVLTADGSTLYVGHVPG